MHLPSSPLRREYTGVEGPSGFHSHYTDRIVSLNCKFRRVCVRTSYHRFSFAMLHHCSCQCPSIVMNAASVESCSSLYLRRRNEHKNAGANTDRSGSISASQHGRRRSQTSSNDTVCRLASPPLSLGAIRQRIYQALATSQGCVSFMGFRPLRSCSVTGRSQKSILLRTVLSDVETARMLESKL